MGNSLLAINDSVSLLANDSLWIESKSIDQLAKTATLTHMVAAAGMPDLHPGRGYPIGAAFLSQGHIYPALVGNDIGCGMALWKTSLKTNKIKLDKLEKQLKKGVSLDQGDLEHWQTTIDQFRAEHGGEPTLSDASLGTIGGGNHFAELQKIEHIYDALMADKIGLDKNKVYFLAHSGSRGLGQSILRNHVDNFNHHGLSQGSDEFQQYFNDHDNALSYAQLNRYLIVQRFFEKLGCDGEEILDVNHNLVSQSDLTEQGFLHRKGATPADQGLVMIPGSRGDYSYLVNPIESENSAKSLDSLAHGAGRKWQRGECKARLSDKYRVQQLKRTALGSQVICDNKDLMFEEAPQAYKSIDSVIEVMLEAGLIELVAKFKPVLTYKVASKKDCC